MVARSREVMTMMATNSHETAVDGSPSMFCVGRALVESGTRVRLTAEAV